MKLNAVGVRLGRIDWMKPQSLPKDSNGENPRRRLRRISAVNEKSTVSFSDAFA